jgi:flagellar biosynthetic protein FliR
MQLLVDPLWGFCVFLLSVRLGTLFVLSPIWSVANVPQSFRVLLVVALSAMLVTATATRVTTLPSSFGAFVLAGASELLVGAVLAFGIFAAFGAFSVAGKILDVQIGFGIGNVFDPVTHSQSPMLGTVLNLLAVTLFFAVDGHQALLRGVAFSLQALPPGTLLQTFPFDAVLRQFGAMFTLSVVLAAPVMFCLLVVDAGIAVVSRNLPQMNIFIVAVPLKIFVGLATMAMSVAYLGPVIAKIFASIFKFWEALFAHG